MKSVIHGTCLLKGVHPKGSDLERECPVHRKKRRQERAKKAARSRWGQPGAPRKHEEGK